MTLTVKKFSVQMKTLLKEKKVMEIKRVSMRMANKNLKEKKLIKSLLQYTLTLKG